MRYQRLLDEMKRQSRMGECLHFDNDLQCSEIIDAHSIQKGGQLSKIAENGHVYRVDFDSNRGQLFFKKTGIEKSIYISGVLQSS